MIARPLLACAALGLVAAAAGQPPADPPTAGVTRLGTGRRVPQSAALVPPGYTRYVEMPPDGRPPAPPGEVANPPLHAGASRLLVDSPAVSADGRRAAGWDGPNLAVWDVATGRTVRAFPTPAGLNYSRGDVAFTALSADGRVLARSYYSSPAAGRIVVRDVDAGEVIGDIPVTGHSGVALSSDGKRVAVWSAVTNPPPAGTAVDPRTTVRVLDARTGAEAFRAPVTPAEGYVTAVAFSPDGRVMAVGAAAGPVDLWDATAGTRTRVLVGVTGQGVRLGFAPDGATVAAVSVGGVTQRWNVADGRLRGTTPPPPDVVRGLPRAVALRSADDGVVWAQGFGLVVWEVPSGRVVSAGADEHSGAVLDVRFGPGGTVVTAGADRRVVRWDAATGRRLGASAPKVPPTGPAPGQGLRARLVPADGRLILSNAARTGVYDLATGDELAAVPSGGRPGDGAVRHFPAGDGTRVVTTFAPTRREQPGSWAVWDAAGQLAGRAEGPDLIGMIVDADVSPSGRRLVTIREVSERLDRISPLTLTGWDVKTGKRLSVTAHPGFLRAATVTAVTDTAALLAGADGRVVVLDYEVGRLGDDLVGPAEVVHLRPPAVAVAAGGRRVAVGGPAAGLEADAVRVYEWPGGDVAATLGGNRSRASALAFSPDGTRLVVGTEDGTVLIRDVPAGAK